ncbi:hypothetical protein ACFL6U_32425 [Planctomycetota bacterium]
MNDKQLKDLLQQSDQVAGNLGPVRIDRVLLGQRARLRRDIRMTGSAALVVMLLLGLWTVWQPSSPQVSNEEMQASARLVYVEQELAQLQDNVEDLLTSMRDMTQRQRQLEAVAQVRQRLSSFPDPEAYVNEQIEQAARVWVVEADQLWQHPRQRPTALRLYRQVLKLYPQSQGARIARTRLRPKQHPYQDKGVL